MEKTQSSAEPSGRNPMQPVMEVLQGANPDAVCAKYGINRADLDKLIHDYQVSRRQAALMENLAVTKAGRNDPCPCGSGKKYKKCCLPRHEEARKNIPPDKLREMEERARKREELEEELKKGFDYLYRQEFEKAKRLGARLLEEFPEEDRLHDILVTACLAGGDYEGAFNLCRRRWQVAKEEREYFEENGHHKREGMNQDQLVHFYSPATWLEKFWIAQRARTYQTLFPAQEDARLSKMAEGLKAANDAKRFPGRQEEGYTMRRKALEPLLEQMIAEGPAVIPYLLPLTYHFSWATLFIPDLLLAFGTDESIRFLAELSMFRFPYFAQMCLANLEKLGERAIPAIDSVLSENGAFDELKTGLLAVLGNVHSPESFGILVKFMEHEEPYVVNWAAQALGRHKNPDALPYLEKAKERLGAHSKIAGAIRELTGGGEL